MLSQAVVCSQGVGVDQRGCGEGCGCLVRASTPPCSLTRKASTPIPCMDTPRYGQPAVSTHPTGMHSCLNLLSTTVSMVLILYVCFLFLNFHLLCAIFSYLTKGQNRNF